jgi:hypothetical protein
LINTLSREFFIEDNIQMIIDFLEQNRESILQEWFNQTINTYEPEMARFLKREKNQFSNPVRNTIITSLEKIYDNILTGDSTDASGGLLEIIKVRAVQDFSPSDALSFLFNLKKIIRSELIKSDQKFDTLNEVNEFDERFDLLLRTAFNYYNECRLKIQDIKMAEIKSRSERAFEIMQKKKN